jgi:RND family efflux transporter MFP subunit
MTGFLWSWRTWGFMGLVLALGGAAWTYRWAKEASTRADPELAQRAGRPIPVRTTSVEESQIYQVIGGTALTQPSQVAFVQLGASAGLKSTDLVFKKIHVHEGDFVTRGKLLFELDDAVLAAIFRQKEAAYNHALAKFRRVEKSVAFKEKDRELGMASANANQKFRTDDLENRRRAFEIIQTLWKEKASTVIEYFNVRSLFALANYELSEADRMVKRAKNALEVGKLQDQSELAEAKNELETARADYLTLQHDLERLQVRSPLDGFINYVSREPVVGQVTDVYPNVLTEVLQLDPLFIRMDFPQERIDDLFVGQKAEIVLDPLPKLKFFGEVIRISPQVNTHLRVLSVTIELPNPNNRIKTGISGFVRLRISKKAQTLPAQAVLQHGSKSMVFRVEDGKARIREVQTGFAADDGKVELRGGVAPGDEIVIFDPMYLNDNVPVDTNWRKWARRE